MRHQLPALFLLALPLPLLVGCQTEMIVAISCDECERIKDVTFSVRNGDGDVESRPYDELTLPHSVLVVPSSNWEPGDGITVHVTAKDEDGGRYMGVVSSGFEEGRTLCLELWLRPRCEDEGDCGDCAGECVCEMEMCMPSDPPHDGGGDTGVDTNPDVSIDSGLPEDTSPDGMDTSPEDASPDVMDTSPDADSDSGSPEDGSPDVMDTSPPPDACTPGSTRCDGDAVATCLPDGTFGDSIPCPSAQPLCVELDEPTCVACEPGHPIGCDGRDRVRCDMEGNVVRNECRGELPVCLEFDDEPTCVECMPGERQCVGDTLQTCGASGLYVDHPCSGATPFCVPAFGECSECVPGSGPRCAGGDQVTCDEAGNEVRTPCRGERPFCNAGTCVECTMDGDCSGGDACTQVECVRGECEREFESGTPCGDRCVDVTTDEANCGSCGLACMRGERCESGLCVGCPSGFCDIGGGGFCEIDLAESPRCASDAAYLGSVGGDSDGEALIATGVGQKIFYFDVERRVAITTGNLSVGVALEVPDGVDYNLRASCSELGCGSGGPEKGPGVDEFIHLHMTRARRIYVTIDYRATPSPSCDPWRLVVTGNVDGLGLACS